MARVTVEDCVDKVPNRFDLVMLAAHRAREISAGGAITVDRDNDKNPVVALREIADRTVDIDDLQETVDRIKSRLLSSPINSIIDMLSILTPTEKEVLKVLVKGTTSTVAAKVLSSSPHTINTHRNHILQKMGCKSILEVVSSLHEK